MASRPYYGAGGYARTEQNAGEDGEGRKRKVGTRRTVDYGCTNAKYLLEHACIRSKYDEKPMRPGLNDIINVTSFAFLTNNRCFHQKHTTIHPPQ